MTSMKSIKIYIEWNAAKTEIHLLPMIDIIAKWFVGRYKNVGKLHFIMKYQRGILGIVLTFKL